MLDYLAVPGVEIFEFLFMPVTTNHFPGWEISVVFNLSSGMEFYKITNSNPRPMPRLPAPPPPSHWLDIDRCIINASVNSSGVHPPPGQPWGICFIVSPGGGAFAILSRPRGWALAYPRDDPRAFDTRVFERQISLSGRMRPLSKTGLSHQELEKFRCF